MAPIRIAQVVEAMEGGCKRHVLGLLRGLDPVRFRQTAVLSPWREAGLMEAVKAHVPDGVELVPWAVQRAIRPWSDLRSYGFLRRLLRERDFDIVHCHSAKAGFLGRLAARGLGGAVLYTPHCFPFMMQTPLRGLYRRLERMAGPHTDRLIAVSPSEVEVATRLRLVPAERVVLIENGIDTGRPPSTISPAGKRAELGIAPEAPVVLSVGALRPQKGYRFLLSAAADVVKQHGGVVFLIAGAGGLRPELEAGISRLGLQGRVRLLGHRSDVPELLLVADCFVVSSLWEGGPFALLEAMAAGVPVVGTRIDGVRDWVRDGETGYAAASADPTSLAEAISDALSDRREAKRRAAAAQAMVRARNSEARWLDDMAALYEEVAAETCDLGHNRPSSP